MFSIDKFPSDCSLANISKYWKITKTLIKTSGPVPIEPRTSARTEAIAKVAPFIDAAGRITLSNSLYIETS